MEIWLNAKLLIEAPDEATAKRLLDEVLQDWARRTLHFEGGVGVESPTEQGEWSSGLVMFDRTGLVEEEDK